MSPVAVTEELRRLPSGHIALRLPAQAEYIGLCRALAATVGQMCRLDASTIVDLKLAVSEACGNAVRHAYPPEGAEARAPEMELECSLGDERIAIYVRDWGRGVGSADAAADTHGAGFGLRLIQALAEEVTVREGAEGVGTTVSFTRPRR